MSVLILRLILEQGHVFACSACSAWSDGLSEELALVRHYIAVYLAIQTKIPT